MITRRSLCNIALFSASIPCIEGIDMNFFVKTSSSDKASDVEYSLNKTLMNFTYVPSGDFILGAKYNNFLPFYMEKPKFKNVKISKGFFISKYLFTVGNLLDLLMLDEYFSDVFDLYWNKARLEKMDTFRPIDMNTESAKLVIDAMNRRGNAVFSFPTEAQWEHACRAGSETNFYNGNTEADLSDVAWYVKNSGRDIHPVGRKRPNHFGIYDMLGTLYEPCRDRLQEEFGDIDPVGRTDSGGLPLTLRGGSILDGPTACTSFYRIAAPGVGGFNNIPIGLRLILS